MLLSLQFNNAMFKKPASENRSDKEGYNFRVPISLHRPKEDALFSGRTNEDNHHQLMQNPSRSPAKAGAKNPLGINPNCSSTAIRIMSMGLKPHF